MYFDIRRDLRVSLLLFVQIIYCISKADGNVVYIAEKCINEGCCDKSQNITTFVCENLTDSANVPIYFSRFNTTYFKLEFLDSKHLPARSFDGRSIPALYIDDSDVTIDENVFEGAMSVLYFDVRRSNVKDIPDFRHVKDSVEVIQIDLSHLTRLEGENLQNLTNLWFASFFENNISYIDPDVFKGNRRMNYITVGGNMLTHIPSNLLNEMNNIQGFSAQRNQLLYVDNLFSVRKPVEIILEYNNITNVSDIFKTMQYENGASNTQRCNSNEDHFSNNLMEATLKTLNLTYNYIQETEQPMFPCYQKNGIGYYLGIGQLGLIGNKLKNLGSLLRYLSISKLYISKNQIQYLTDKDFTNTIDVKLLELQENEITRIDTETFVNLRESLKVLDLSSNLITSLNGSIRYLYALEVLSLKYNSLQLFRKDEFAGLKRLSFLLLQHNHIKSIDSLQALPRLEFLNVTGNEIEVIYTHTLPNALRHMEFSSNPFKCNCHLLEFLVLITRAPKAEICLENETSNIQHESSSCPSVCLCACAFRRHVIFLFANCSSRNLSIIPEFPTNYITKHNIARNYQRPVLMHLDINYLFRIEDNILGFNFENNNLKSLEQFQFPPNLIQLRLSKNRLTHLPESIFKEQHHLEEVTLSGNPWKCDCDTVKFKDWLTSQRTVINDIEDVRCGLSEGVTSHLNGRVIWNLTDVELCPTDVSVIIFTSSGVIIVLTLCFASMILYARYNLNIKIFLYSHGLTFVKEEEHDSDKEFDAFISFCHKDGEFTTKDIITVIEEKDPRIRLCVHYRNFTAGELIYNNIVYAVYNSKRTVVILSENFLESEWCMVEFQTAHMLSLEDKINRIIIIKLGDLPKEIDPTIKAYLDSTTYLTWSETNFFMKLFYALPNGNGKEDIPQEV